MRLRSVTYCAIAVGLVAASSAMAAPAKKSCNLITDESGDGSHKTTGYNSQILDIVGGDVATGKNNLVGVLRLKSANVNSEPAAALGVKWYLTFKIQGANYAFVRSRPMGGTGWTDSLTLESTAIATPAVKVEGNNVIFTVPKKDVPNLKKPRMVFTDLGASSALGGGNADTATSKSTYADTTPSCVPAA